MLFPLCVWAFRYFSGDRRVQGPRSRRVGMARSASPRHADARPNRRLENPPSNTSVLERPCLGNGLKHSTLLASREGRCLAPCRPGGRRDEPGVRRGRRPNIDRKRPHRARTLLPPISRRRRPAPPPPAAALLRLAVPTPGRKPGAIEVSKSKHGPRAGAQALRNYF